MVIFSSMMLSNRTKIHTPYLRAPKLPSINNGFAMLSALWFSAIISIISLSMVGTFLANTQNITREAQAVQTDFLHDAALNYAVLDLLKPRKSVVLGGVPHPSLRYENNLAPVDIIIKNEAAFLDLKLTPISVLTPIFNQLELSQNVIKQIEYAVRSETLDQTAAKVPEKRPQQSVQSLNLRWLKQLLGPNEAAFSKITEHTSFYNGSTQINQNTVSEALLRALPDLNASDASALLDIRNSTNKDLIGDAINHPMLSNRASSHYRVTTSVTLGATTSRKTRIIHIANTQSQRLFSVVAQL